MQGIIFNQSFLNATLQKLEDVEKERDNAFVQIKHLVYQIQLLKTELNDLKEERGVLPSALSWVGGLFKKR